MASGRDHHRDRPRYSRDSDSDEDDKHVVSWIPGENLEVEALAFYLREFIDARANIRPSTSPGDGRRQGFLITAKYTLSYDQVQDIMSDSRNWYKEKRSRAFAKEPYNYTESDTAEQRIRRGAASGAPKPIPTRRRRQHGEGSVQAGSGENLTQVTSRHDPRYATVGSPPNAPPPERPSHPDPDSFQKYGLESRMADLDIRRSSKAHIPSSELPIAVRASRDTVTAANTTANRHSDKDRDRHQDKDNDKDKDSARDALWSKYNRYDDPRQNPR